jgi:hypothetical protein
MPVTRSKDADATAIGSGSEDVVIWAVVLNKMTVDVVVVRQMKTGVLLIIPVVHGSLNCCTLINSVRRAANS